MWTAIPCDEWTSWTKRRYRNVNSRVRGYWMKLRNWLLASFIIQKLFCGLSCSHFGGRVKNWEERSNLLFRRKTFGCPEKNIYCLLIGYVGWIYSVWQPRGYNSCIIPVCTSSSLISPVYDRHYWDWWMSYVCFIECNSSVHFCRLQALGDMRLL